MLDGVRAADGPERPRAAASPRRRRSTRGPPTSSPACFRSTAVVLDLGRHRAISRATSRRSMGEPGGAGRAAGTGELPSAETSSSPPRAGSDRLHRRRPRRPLPGHAGRAAGRHPRVAADGRALARGDGLPLSEPLDRYRRPMREPTSRRGDARLSGVGARPRRAARARRHPPLPAAAGRLTDYRTLCRAILRVSSPRSSAG